jgi:hypothetical protein
MLARLTDDCLLEIVKRLLRGKGSAQRYFTVIYLTKQFYRVTNRVPLDWCALGARATNIHRWRWVAPNAADDARWKALVGARFRERGHRRVRAALRVQAGVGRVSLRLRKYLLYGGSGAKY